MSSILRHHPIKFYYYPVDDNLSEHAFVCREIEGIIARQPLGAPQPTPGAPTNWAIVNPEAVPDLRALVDRLQRPLLLPEWFSRCVSAGCVVQPIVDETILLPSPEVFPTYLVRVADSVGADSVIGGSVDASLVEPLPHYDDGAHAEQLADTQPHDGGEVVELWEQPLPPEPAGAEATSSWEDAVHHRYGTQSQSQTH
jgi:hypothetical protein